MRINLTINDIFYLNIHKINDAQFCAFNFDQKLPRSLCKFICTSNQSIFFFENLLYESKNKLSIFVYIFCFMPNCSLKNLKKLLHYNKYAWYSRFAFYQMKYMMNINTNNYLVSLISRLLFHIITKNELNKSKWRPIKCSIVDSHFYQVEKFYM